MIYFLPGQLPDVEIFFSSAGVPEIRLIINLAPHSLSLGLLVNYSHGIGTDDVLIASRKTDCCLDCA